MEYLRSDPFSVSSFLLVVLFLVLNSETVPNLVDSDIELAEFQSAFHPLGKTEEHNLLAMSKILFGTMDFIQANCSANLLRASNKIFTRRCCILVSTMK